jgi:MFS family permease
MKAGSAGRLPRGVLALGFTSLFMDFSSEMIHAALPLFLTATLGASVWTLGWIEGVAEATASVSKVFAGAASDWLGRRKPFALLGYGLAALSKPLFPLAASASTVLLARVVDRVGKGIRGAPRDALVADLTPAARRGAAYGLRQGLDTVGAVLGPAAALLLLAATGDDFRAVFWLAAAPAFVSVAVLALFVREPARAPTERTLRSPVRRRELARLPRRYWLVVAFGAALTLARFSEAFLVLRAQDVGLALSYVPLVMIVMSGVYAASAYPAGAAADRMSARGLLLYGLLFLIAADVVLAFAGSPLVVLAGAALWGLHMGLTQGLLSKLVADAVPAHVIGTGFGIFNLVTGGALLLASVVAGALWGSLGPSTTFLAGATFAALAAIGLLFAVPRHLPAR